jgi:hypothetical protein
METKNIVCLKHPRYDGVASPDLSCKVCCSKFVARIRAEQQKLFEPTWNQNAGEKNAGFTPTDFKSDANKSTSSKRQANFDGSWI